MSAAKQTMTWNGEADAKLLLAILKVSDVKPDFDAVSKQLTTDTITCTPRAVQEHLKKLRKLAQSDGDSPAPSKPAPTTPVKGFRKVAATPAAGVKKTRKPATGGKGKKTKSAPAIDDAEETSVKVEIGSDDGNDMITPKKRKYDDAIDGSSDAGEESPVGSELADLAQAGLDDKITA